ncbi:MAG: TonB-dependent receptor, partial [Bacteroidetes bacterium CG_4_10_14_3_um_filter_42_6]
MKKIFFIISIMFWALISPSQIITLLDNETNQPLDLATISCNTPKISLITNANGQADISQLKAAAEIQLQILGFESQVISYESIAQQQFIVKMIRNSFSLDQVVVSATRWKQNLREIPAKILTITPRQMA